METAFQADAFQIEPLAFQILVTAPVTDTGTARTAAGGPTGVKHRKRYLYPTPEELRAEEERVLAEAIQTALPEEAATAEEDDSEMMEALAAFLSEDF